MSGKFYRRHWTVSFVSKLLKKEGKKDSWQAVSYLLLCCLSSCYAQLVADYRLFNWLNFIIMQLLHSGSLEDFYWRGRKQQNISCRFCKSRWSGTTHSVFWLNNFKNMLKTNKFNINATTNKTITVVASNAFVQFILKFNRHYNYLNVTAKCNRCVM